MPFFGRQREKWVAEEVIGSQVGSACLFVGEAGIGKTALADEFARIYDTVVVRISPNERMWPYSGLSALAAGLGGHRASAVDAVLVRGRDWPEHMLAEEISRTLHLISDEPAVLVIDDLDMMDASSATVLSYVLGRVRGTGIAVLATVGAEGRSAFAGLVHTRIDPLSFGESVDLARSALGPGTARGVLHIVAAFTGGNPGVVARVRLTPDETSGDAPLPLPLRLADDPSAPRRRGTRAARDPRTTELLDLLSVGPVFGHDRLRAEAAARGLDLDDVIESGLVAVHGELARIVDPALRLRHHAGLPADERRRLHAHAAQVHDGAHPATHRWHASFLDPAHDDGARLLVAAVDLAQDGDAASAVEFAERALLSRLDPAERQRLLVELGDALVRQGHFVLAQHYLKHAGVIADGSPLAARAALAQVRSVAVVDHIVDDALIDDAVARAGIDDALRLLSEATRFRLMRGEFGLARARVRHALDLDPSSREFALLARVVGLIGPADASIEVSSGTTGGALSRPLSDVDVEEATLLVVLHVIDEEYPAARRWCVSLLDRAPRLEPLWRERVLRLLVATEVRAGDASAARDAVAAWRREWLPGRQPDAASVLLLASAAALDPDDEVDDLVRRGRALCRREGTPGLLRWFAAIEGARALADGRYDRATASLQAAVDAVADDDPATVRAAGDLVEALWLSGRRAEAHRELARFEADAARRPRRWSTLAIARARAVCRSEEAGTVAFREAEALYRTDDAPDEHGRLSAARERCFPSAPRDGRPAPARATPRADPLTAQEREVAALVEQGLRNREIAASLFVSLRTVELRLTNIYRKLGVTSRGHLVALLHGGATG